MDFNRRPFGDINIRVYYGRSSDYVPYSKNSSYDINVIRRIAECVTVLYTVRQSNDLPYRTVLLYSKHYSYEYSMVPA